jgi:DNA-directed RNA polymerase subunit RPC12/RpoP
MLETIRCERCAGPTTFVTELSPLGSDPGHRVYYCAACKQHTWTTSRPSLQQQQQQQQQPK